MKVKNSKLDQNLMPFSEKLEDHLWFMKLSLEQADLAWKLQEVPIGAVIVDSKGEILARTHNLKETAHDACGHAEILAIQEASKKLNSWRLNDCRLYVTLEPCPMCLSAIGQARLSQVIFGAYDRKGGAISLGYPLHNDQRLNHRFSVMGGVMHFECSKQLSDFFKQRRASHGSV
ncbi:MAG: nucleoside deaminase [Bacteriovoracaceae bacterium]|nr:nucleoside deaminase [Bacteriovoracaceae bacterium]